MPPKHLAYTISSCKEARCIGGDRPTSTVRGGDQKNSFGETEESRTWQRYRRSRGCLCSTAYSVAAIPSFARNRNIRRSAIPHRTRLASQATPRLHHATRANETRLANRENASQAGPSFLIPDSDRLVFRIASLLSSVTHKTPLGVAARGPNRSWKLQSPGRAGWVAIFRASSKSWHFCTDQNWRSRTDRSLKTSATCNCGVRSAGSIATRFTTHGGDCIGDVLKKGDLMGGAGRTPMRSSPDCEHAGFGFAADDNGTLRPTNFLPSPVSRVLSDPISECRAGMTASGVTAPSNLYGSRQSFRAARYVLEQLKHELRCMRCHPLGNCREGRAKFSFLHRYL